MTGSAINRILQPPSESFFLFGPRSVGKSFWLKQHFGDAVYFDLLENRTYLELSRDPSIIEAKIGALPPGTWICIDEVQKIPALLSEVHRLIENKGYRFALSGSSARKLKRSGADLLAGRAITLRMEGFSSVELGKDFDIASILEWGSLPLVVKDLAKASDILSAYVHTYIKEEIREEGLVRSAEPFIRFLEVAGIVNGQVLNKGNIARDAKVPRSTVDVYFSILEDTLLCHFLPAFRPVAKVREQAHSKFYWFDAGVARAAAGLTYDNVDSIWRGFSLETLIFHEMRVYDQAQNKNRKFFYYSTASGSEIDFIIETQRKTSSNRGHVVCIEVKNSKAWDKSWEKPMRSFSESDKFVVDRMFGVYNGTDSYHFDGIDVLPVGNFLKEMYGGRVF